MPTEDPPLHSIGDVAQATGLTTHTIRVWERRYGRPTPLRLPSGQRRYTMQQVYWLRRVAEALARGHRASKIVRADEAELAEILAPPPDGSETTLKSVGRILADVRELQGERIQARLAKALQALGPRSFLVDLVSPLLARVGRAWADGELEVRHEHLLTEVLEDLLRRARQDAGPPARGARILFATLEEERHGLGLQMVALLAACKGVRAHILGTEAPTLEIVRAMRETGAQGLAISVSLSTGGVATDRRIAEIRAQLPEDIPVLVGGAGARGVRRGVRGVDYAGSLAEFEQWIDQYFGEEGGRG